MKKIAFAGTFDPITNGHLWVIEEGISIADEVVVMIAHNPSKQTLFSEEQRKNMIEQAILQNGWQKKVKVVLIKNEYIAQSAQLHGCDYLIRGIRSALDFDYESLIQKTNTDVLVGVKTLFVMPPRDLESVSSSYVKSLIGPVGWHWYIKDFVPQSVYDAWLRKYITTTTHKNTQGVWKNTINSQMVVDSLLEQVFTAYSNNSRFYHNLEHIAHCLQELQWCEANYKLSSNLIEQLTIGLLCHDIIYNSDNKETSDEEQSATWFESFARKIGHDNESTNIIANMIRKTAYLSGKVKAETSEEKLLCSIDLSILAQSSKVYNWYSKMVRKEYSFVSDEDFHKGRITVLETLVKNDRLYLHEYYQHYEQRAKKNLLLEIETLKK